MKTANKIVDGILKVVMALTSLLLFIVTFLQVVSRFIFKTPLAWSQDVIRLCFVYLVFWGAAYCLKEKAHLNVDVFLTALKPKIRKIVEIIINLVLLLFFAFIIYFGFSFVKTGLTQNAPYLPIPMSLFYLSVPTSAIFMFYYMVQQIFGQIKTFNEIDSNSNGR
nr:TRAP transporter small permease [Sedimentibacter sp.]